MAREGPVLAVLRHADYQQPADTPSAWLPYPLTEKGQEQSAEAAECIMQFSAKYDIEALPAIDSSNMLRAWQTASIIAQSIDGATVEQFDALAERSVGAVANLTTRQIERLLVLDPRYELPPRGWKSASDFRLPFQGAESLLQAGERVARHLSGCMDIAQENMEYTGKRRMKVVVAHGASLRHAAMHLGLLNRETVGAVSMYHARPLFLSRVDQKWHILDGEWKPRSGRQQGDEYGTA